MWLFFLFAALLTAAVVAGILMPIMKSPQGPSTADKKLALFLVLAVPLLTIVIYLALGRPDLPGRP